MTALTSKDDEHEYLKSLGAGAVLARGMLTMSGSRPLEKSLWAGAVDAVGGETLGWLIKTMHQNATIAISGLTGGTELHTTVLPFILRGVKLLGIDSAFAPTEKRREVWQRLSTDLRPKALSTTIRDITLDELPRAFATLLEGKARGRFVVKIS